MKRKYDYENSIGKKIDQNVSQIEILSLNLLFS